MENWYIIYVLKNDEDKIKTFLIKKGLNAFIPSRDVIFKRNGNKFLVRKPLFPNYIFIKSELDQQTFIAMLNNLKKEKKGIVRLLIYDKEGTPTLNIAEKAMLKKMMNKENVIVHSNGYMIKQRVMITDGPLCGLESKIVAVNQHKDYAKILINIFDREIYVKVSLNIIEKIKEDVYEKEKKN